MNHFAIDPGGLFSLSAGGKVFKNTTTLPVDAYCYIVSRMLEAAMKGDTNVTIPSAGFSEEEIEKVSNTFYLNPNGIILFYEGNQIRVEWRISY